MSTSPTGWQLDGHQGQRVTNQSKTSPMQLSNTRPDAVVWSLEHAGNSQCERYLIYLLASRYDRDKFSCRPASICRSENDSTFIIRLPQRHLDPMFANRGVRPRHHDLLGSLSKITYSYSSRSTTLCDLYRAFSRAKYIDHKLITSSKKYFVTSSENGLMWHTMG
jgi:hypothetical protein